MTQNNSAKMFLHHINTDQLYKSATILGTTMLVLDKCNVNMLKSSL